MTVVPEKSKPEINVATPQVYVDSETEPILATAVPATEPAVASDPLWTSGRSRTGRGCDCLLCGDTRLRGPRIRAGCNSFVRICGSVNVDLRETPLPPSGTRLRFFILMLCGDARFILPRGVDIVVRRVALCGDKDIDIDDAALTVASSTVVVTIINLCGTVVVRNTEGDM